LKLGENDEIVARGPNIFSGFWNRPQETARRCAMGWFHTGDQGEVDSSGNWRIVVAQESDHSRFRSQRRLLNRFEEKVLKIAWRITSGFSGKRQGISFPRS